MPVRIRIPSPHRPRAGTGPPAWPADLAATDVNNHAASGGHPARPDDVLMGPGDFLVVHGDFHVFLGDLHEVYGSVHEKIIWKIKDLAFSWRDSRSACHVAEHVRRAHRAKEK
ncbi:MAG: hypothetical protein LBP86_06845 [Azoarcus sp.]|jgi:hypothetical protein|nr:hypothetical protein [Azoarcus sp.]